MLNDSASMTPKTGWTVKIRGPDESRCSRPGCSVLGTVTRHPLARELLVGERERVLAGVTRD